MYYIRDPLQRFAALRYGDRHRKVLVMLLARMLAIISCAPVRLASTAWMKPDLKRPSQNEHCIFSSGGPAEGLGIGMGTDAK